MEISAGSLCCLSFLLAVSATSVDAVGPRNTAVLRGGAANLTCSNPAYTSTSSGAARWAEGWTTFATQQGGIYTGPGYAKYTNFGIVSDEFLQMDLTVSDAQVEDEGTYTCTMITNQGSATLTVEIEGNEPTITLDGDSSGNPIRLTAGEQSVLRCTASGFRPAVNLEWYKDDVEITAGITEDTPTDNGDTFTTSGTLTLTPTKQDDGNLECRTTGQVIATTKTGELTLNVQYAPIVNVDFRGGRITCLSDANPLAASKIILNGTDILVSFIISGGSVEFTPDYCTYISCNSTNAVGTRTGTFAKPICPALDAVGPSDTAVLRGDDATLTCSNPAYTSPRSGAAQWSEGPTPFATQQLGGPYTGSHFAKYTNFGIVSVVFPQMDLTVSNAQIEDEGTYTCTMITEQGSATLTVENAPVVKVAYSGGRITCLSDANPLAASHQIILNGTDIVESFNNTGGSVEFTPEYCTYISCNSTNAVGTGTGTFAKPICPAASSSSTAVGAIVGAVAAAFIVGVLVSGILIFYLMKRRHRLQHETDGLPKTIKHDGDRLKQDEPYERTIKPEKRNQELPLTTRAPSPIAVYESIRDDAGGEASRTSTAEVYSNVGTDLAFPRDLVVIEKELGRGAFGRVLLGTALGIEKTGKRTKVAVKTLKEGGGDHAKAELLEELELMKKVGCHPNVVKLLGHCKEKDPVYVIVEYLARGDLKKLLMKYRDKDPGTGYSNLPGLSKSLSRTLVKFARDVANGMAFISSQKCVHRDLAARNVLVGEDMVCKVSDFGLARDVMNTRFYQRESQGALPMRWMALESLLDDVYTTKSDVWSFGILLWEIVTLGARPYPTMKTKAMVSQLQQGYRMPKPKNCKKQLYDMMRSCWQKTPRDRPTFQSLCQQLDDMLSGDKDYITIHKLDESIYEMIVIEDTNEKL